MSDRESLFGNKYKKTDNTGYNFNAESQKLYEEDNDREIESLGKKLSSLKHMAMDIGKEVDDHNKILEGIEAQLSGVKELVSGTVEKLSEMINQGGSKHMCLLILLVVGLFMFLYTLTSFF